MPSILNTHMKPGTSRMAEYCVLRTALLNSSARPWSFLLELAIPPSLHYHTLTYLNVHSYTAQTTPTRITPRSSRVRIPLKLQASWFPRQLALATSESLDFGGRFSNFLSAPADFVWTAIFKSAKGQEKGPWMNRSLPAFILATCLLKIPQPLSNRLEFPTKLFSFQLLFFRLGRNLGYHFQLHLVDDLRAEHSWDGGE